MRSNAWQYSLLFDSTGAEAAAKACGKGEWAETDAIVYAEAIAEATARAISYAVADCTVKGAGYACAASGAHIKTIANAYAKAFASAYAEAIACDCKVDAEVTAKSIGSITAKAASSAYVEVCGGALTQLHQDLLRFSLGAANLLDHTLAHAKQSMTPHLCCDQSVAASCQDGLLCIAKTST